MSESGGRESEPDAFFEPTGDGRYMPSVMTRGPWDPDHQHGGPPCALIGGAIESHEPDGTDRRVARITFEFLRPVPIAPLALAVRTARPGRNVELIEAELAAGEGPVLIARAWRIATAELPEQALSGSEPPGPPPPPPAEASAEPFFETGQEVGYHTAMDFRFAHGEFRRPGPATVWMRSPRPILAGGPALTPLQRVLVAADSGSGVGAALDWKRWMFINTELTVHLAREPVGEWVGLDAETRIAADGIGLCETRLFDAAGTIGRGGQALLVRPRSG